MPGLCSEPGVPTCGIYSSTCPDSGLGHAVKGPSGGEADAGRNSHRSSDPVRGDRGSVAREEQGDVLVPRWRRPSTSPTRGGGRKQRPSETPGKTKLHVKTKAPTQSWNEACLCTDEGKRERRCGRRSPTSARGWADVDIAGVAEMPRFPPAFHRPAPLTDRTHKSPRIRTRTYRRVKGYRLTCTKQKRHLRGYLEGRQRPSTAGVETEQRRSRKAPLAQQVINGAAHCPPGNGG